MPRVDFQWLSFLLRKSHWTRPGSRGSFGSISSSARIAQAWVSIVSLYQSQPRSSGAQKVPSSRVVFAESITLASTSRASAPRSARSRVIASMSFNIGECCCQCLNEKSSTFFRSDAGRNSSIQAGSG